VHTPSPDAQAATSEIAGELDESLVSSGSHSPWLNVLWCEVLSGDRSAQSNRPAFPRRVLYGFQPPCLGLRLPDTLIVAAAALQHIPQLGEIGPPISGLGA